MKFQKPSTSIEEQISILRKRGMEVADEELAFHYLSHISYYRLRAYWLLFEDRSSISDEHKFLADVEFGSVVDLYIFDRKLRLHLLDAFERIEVSVRGHWAHHMAMKYGSHGYLDNDLYANQDHFEIGLEKLRDSVGRSTDTFIAHYNSKYSAPQLPPVWMSVELFPLGQLSKWFNNLKLKADKQAIAGVYGTYPKSFSSFLRNAAYVRNICAHHGRLWNKQLTVTLQPAKYPQSLSIASSVTTNRKRLYLTLVAIVEMLKIVAPNSNWKADLVSLLQSCQSVDMREMGFPEDWLNMPFWKTNE